MGRCSRLGGQRLAGASMHEEQEGVQCHDSQLPGLPPTARMQSPNKDSPSSMGLHASRAGWARDGARGEARLC